MATEGINRKLTAILNADVVGYSRLMAEDEVATVQRLKSYREQIGSRVKEHHGRVVDSPGDNILAEFPSALDATRCAVEIQQALKNRNSDLPDNRKMEFRIGIHLGDVMVSDDRIYGDGVNIAARLEGFADPGGICISAAVHEQVKAKLDLNYRDLGSQMVKNFPDPVRIYKVLHDYAKAPHREIKAKADAKKTLRNISLIAAAAIIVSMASFLIRLTPQKDAPTVAVNVATPLNTVTVRPVEKPSIAVLPFDNISADPDQEYFADGMTEEIITKLSQSRRLFVIARNSTFTYKGKPIKVQSVSQELGARYVIEGSVRKAGNRMRITAQMIDAMTGNHLWSEIYNRKYSINEIFNIQDEISEQIAGAVLSEHTAFEVQRVSRIPTDNLNAYDSYWRALKYFNAYTEASYIKAIELLEHTVTLDPEFAESYALLSNIFWGCYWNGWAFDAQEALKKATKMAEQAIALDDSNVRAHFMLGRIYSHLSEQKDKAFAEARRAVALDPNNADAYNSLGQVYINIGSYENAVEVIEKAILLNPHDTAFYSENLGRAYCMLGRHEEAISSLNQALSINPNDIYAYYWLSFSYIYQWVTQQTNDSENLHHALESAKKAVALSDDSAWPHSQLGYAYLWNNQYLQAIAQAEKGKNISPDDPIVVAFWGYILNRTGRSEDAIKALEKLEYLKTEAAATAWVLFELGWAYHLTGQYEEAITSQRKGFIYHPSFWTAFEARLQLISSYIELDRLAEAEAEAAEVLKLVPNFSVDIWGERDPHQDQEIIQKCMVALRKAGLK